MAFVALETGVLSLHCAVRSASSYQVLLLDPGAGNGPLIASLGLKASRLTALHVSSVRVGPTDQVNSDALLGFMREVWRILPES